MGWDENKRQAIFGKTGGKCHICHTPLKFDNYARFGKSGAWEIDHSIPRKKGGTDHGNNLFPACITCNRSKQENSSSKARNAAGYRRSPLTPRELQKAQMWAGIRNAGIMALIGVRFAGPAGALIGGLIGLAIGLDEEPDCT